MKYFSISFLLIILLTCCHNKLKPVEDNTLIISGNIKEFEGKTLYLKRISAISFNDDSIIDSSEVDINGNFAFKHSQSLPVLLNVSKYKRQHPIHEILQNEPSKYFYGYCAMFFIPEPTFYLARNSDIQIDWTVSEQIDRYNFDSETAKDQLVFYNYYLNENIGGSLYQTDGNFKKMNPTTAWNSIEKAINNTLDKYKLSSKNLDDQFSNYLYTEICLGAINIYANWYEYSFKEELQDAFSKSIILKQYDNIFNIYINSNWNINSVEHYKMTERYMTYQLNKLHKKFNNYYPVNEEKISIANEYLNSSIALIYTHNITRDNK